MRREEPSQAELELPLALSSGHLPAPQSRTAASRPEIQDLGAVREVAAQPCVSVCRGLGPLAGR